MNDREAEISVQILTKGNMKRTLHIFTLTLLVCACAHAATINTTLTVTNASGSISGTGFAFSGQATLTGIGNGTFTGTLSLTPTSTGNFSAPFTIALTTGDRITGTLSIPPTAIGGGALTATATITGGTGAYAGATGSFPSLTGSLSVGLTVTLSITGAGTIVTGGGGPVTPTGPAITDVLDAASYTKNIAQGSIFVVKGTNLSASGFTQFAFPLPTTSPSGGVKITFTRTGGTPTDAYLVYLYNQGGVNQLAAVLPSTVAPGNYNVTVTNGTASAPFAVQVVQRKIGLITADSTGSGLAVVQNYISPSQLDIDRFTTFSSSGFTFSPSKPGQVLIAWATGMGPVTGGDNIASPGFDFAASGVTVRVIVGGVTITPLYAGRAPGLAGADQINFALPANVPTGCVVPFQVSVNGVLSNPTFIAIAPDGDASACLQPGFTESQLQRYDQGATYTSGGFSILQISQTVPELGSVKFNTAGGSFTRFTGFQLAALAQYQAQTSTSGACTVTHTVSSSSDAPSFGGTGLDAGAVTLSGPSGSNLSNTAFTQDARSYSYSLILGAEGIPIPGGSNARLVPGTYTLNGAGGKDVGRFSAAVTMGSPLTVTGGLPSVVNRGAGLTLNWNGGNASDPVQIIGSSSTFTGTGLNQTADTWSFICTTTAGAGTFTVPPSILNQLPPVSAAAATSGTGGGSLMVSSGVNASFTAPLVAGGNIDGAAFVSWVGIGASPAYQ